MDQQAYISILAASERFGISPALLTRLINEGKIKSVDFSSESNKKKTIKTTAEWVKMGLAALEMKVV